VRPAGTRHGVVWRWAAALLVALVVAIAGWRVEQSALARPASLPQVTRPAPQIFPRVDDVALASQRHAVGPDFAAYYAAHQGKAWLGAAITPEIPTGEGLVQIFVGGELRVSAAAGAVSPVDLVPQLIGSGAEVPLAATASTLTYRSLWPALAANALVAPPRQWRPHGDPAATGIFVAQGSAQSGEPLGHYIPATFAGFLEQFGNWVNSVGLPLTEAQQGIIWVQGVQHRLLVQPFERAMLVVDLDAPGSPQVGLQPVGADAISIFGPPPLDGSDGRPAWTVAATQVLPGPSVGEPFASLGSGFPVALAGDAVWISGALWFRVSWKNLLARSYGWLPASALAFMPPAGTGATMADLGALSPQLGAFASSQGDQLAVAVFVPEERRWYLDNPDVAIATASTIKVPILIELLRQAEAQGRSLTAGDQDLAQAMIENSDNDAAAALYAAIGDNAGIDDVMSAAGASGLTVDTSAFGFSETEPGALVDLLAALAAGKLLDAADTSYVLNLMENVEPDQRMGVGDTAPAGASVALKDGYGWVATGDGWVTDSMGIVTLSGHSYIIAVLARRYASLDVGWSVVDAICRDVAAALTQSNNQS
jgi:beta-lactamase class A